MVTLVTKQDLWWDRRNEVSEHYERGKYSNILDGIRKHRGANFNHTFVSSSLNLLNFSTKDGALLRKTIEGYDSSLWIANYNNVIESIRSIMKD
jgi:hypothetical protein